MSVVELVNHTAVDDGYKTELLSAGSYAGGLRLPDEREIVFSPEYQPLGFALVDRVSILRNGQSNRRVSLDVELTVPHGDLIRSATLVFHPTLIPEEELARLDRRACKALDRYEYLNKKCAKPKKLKHALRYAERTMGEFLTAYGWDGEYYTSHSYDEEGPPLDDSPLGIRARIESKRDWRNPTRCAGNPASINGQRTVKGAVSVLATLTTVAAATVPFAEVQTQQVVPPDGESAKSSIDLLAENVQVSVVGYRVEQAGSVAGEDEFLADRFTSDKQLASAAVADVAIAKTAEQTCTSYISVDHKKGTVPNLGPIAMNYGVSIADILAANGVTEAWELAKYGSILVPQYEECSEAQNGSGSSSGRQVVERTVAISVGTYTVKAGETLFAISRRSGISIDALARYNGISDPDKIWAGQKLVIPTQEQIKSMPSLTSTRASGARATAEPLNLSSDSARISEVAGAASESREARNYLLYKVQPSDNIVSLEARFGLRPGSIFGANPQLRELGGVLIPGMKLRITDSTLELPARDEAVEKLIKESSVVGLPIERTTPLSDYVKPGVEYDAVLALNPDIDIDGSGNLSAGQTILVLDTVETSRQSPSFYESTSANPEEVAPQSFGNEEVKVGDELVLTKGVAAKTTTLIKSETGEVVKGQDGRVLTQVSTLFVPEGSKVKVVGEIVVQETGEKMALVRLLEDIQNPDSGTELKKGQIFQISPDWIFTSLSTDHGDSIGGLAEEAPLTFSRENPKYFKEDIEDIPGCHSWLVLETNYQIENNKDPESPWYYCGQDGDYCYLTTYQEPPSDGVCRAHYIISSRPVDVSEIENMDGSDSSLSVLVDRQGNQEITVNFSGFSEYERYTVLEGRLIRVLGELGLVFGGENVHFDSSNLNIKKGLVNGWYGGGDIELSNPESILHEMVHGVSLPYLSDYPALREAWPTYLEARATGYWEDGSDFIDYTNNYDDKNVPGLREQSFQIDQQYYQLAGQAIARLEEQLPGFSRKINISYNNWLNNEVFVKKPLTEDEFKSLVESNWPGGWDKVQEQHILFMKP